MLDSSAAGPGFKSQPRRCRVAVLGKLFTKQRNLVAVLLRVARVTAGLALGNRVRATFTTFFSLLGSGLVVQLVSALLCVCLQCFDAVGWAAGRASGL